MLATVHDLKLVTFRTFADARGSLVAIETAQAVPFPVGRLFSIHDVPPGASRGAHAHKACHQYMICVTGKLRVDAFDGDSERAIEIPAGSALHVPPGIFGTIFFDDPHSVLVVLCDRPYEAGDYLMDRAALIEYRRGLEGRG